MSDSIITCKNVCVSYGRQEVLRNVNLEIPRGIFLPFAGPNGSGKTTLLRAILGLVPVKKGTIQTPFRHQPAGYVPQHKAIDPLYPVSSRQIVAMGLYPKITWWRPLSREQRVLVDQSLERLGMLEYADKTFRELSGGMKQKVLIARAFVSGAEVIVMDEPTSELDEVSEKEVLNHLMELNQEHQKTILMVHHDLELVSTLSPWVCRLRCGEASLSFQSEGAHNA